MKAWQLERLGGALTLQERPIPEPGPGAVVVRMQASSLMSYMQDYVAGDLPNYRVPDSAFVPGGNGTGVIHAVGEGVWHLHPGQRVVTSSHFVANENVREPAQVLLGITALAPPAERVQAHWPDGTLCDYALLPASVATPAEGLDAVDPVRLAVTTRFVVPYGGLLRGRLAAGETVVVSGATGAYGSAAVLLALAMGAGRVVAVGRNRQALDALVAAAGERVVAVSVAGDAQADAQAIRDAAGGGAQLAFDMVGGAHDPNLTLAALRSLSRGGRLVLMGSMRVPLPIPYAEMMLNDWELLGQFMYPRDAYRRVLDLVRAGLLDLNSIRARTYALPELPAAMAAAASAGNLDCVVMTHGA
ncbi:zinc-binding dehydrogenase [Lysobacter sp. K5869]|uniref:zinc-binding dehydrogenase n=1 Tax=Lysobacter sp. K5869 TaxID=2820808 RepID=UPI001C063CD6|nr:zinc-binding dehydrogenase [Lysobacter sp. K5869]QWP75397.1 zinc-binding dehydrogenase [Lysobacter sp. K5869]